MPQAQATKQCSHCKQIRPTHQFRRNRTCADGLHYACKICLKNYAASPHSKATKAAYQSRYRKEHPDKYRAHVAITNCILRGTFPSAIHFPCIECGNPASAWHHPNGYENSHVFDVVAVCCVCHSTIHRKEILGPELTPGCD